MTDEGGGRNAVGIQLPRGSAKELGRVIELDDAFADRGDEEGGEDSEELFLGDNERDKAEGKQRDGGREEQLHTADKKDCLWL